MTHFRKITETLKNNKTYCFSTKTPKSGWCATCKVTTMKSVLTDVNFSTARS